MIRFAVKFLIVLLITGHVIKLTETNGDDPAHAYVQTVSHTMETATHIPDASDFSTTTNMLIVTTRTARDVSGFCEREALACDAGKELLIQLAEGVALAARHLSNDEHTPDTSDIEAEYNPLAEYKGDWPVLPASPLPRPQSF